MITQILLFNLYNFDFRFFYIVRGRIIIFNASIASYANVAENNIRMNFFKEKNSVISDIVKQQQESQEIEIS